MVIFIDGLVKLRPCGLLVCLFVFVCDCLCLFAFVCDCIGWLASATRGQMETLNRQILYVKSDQCEGISLKV